jgi:hypothetical protein
VLEIAEREPKETSVGALLAQAGGGCLVRVSSAAAGHAGPGGRVLASETGPCPAAAWAEDSARP